MKLLVADEFKHLDEVEFIRELLTTVDTSMLHSVTLRRYSGSRVAAKATCYGNCKHPVRGMKKGVKSKYRISASVVGNDSMLPRRGPKRYHAGTPRSEYWCNTIGELFIFVVGHELFHYLAGKGDMTSNNRDEVRADKMGRACVELYRKVWKENAA